MQVKKSGVKNRGREFREETPDVRQRLGSECYERSSAMRMKSASAPFDDVGVMDGSSSTLFGTFGRAR